MGLKQSISRCFAGSSSHGATGHASAPLPRRRFPTVNGMLASLGARRSSGPPAPRATSFDQLPADALGTVVRKLSDGPRAEAGRNLAHASLANKALQAAVAGDEHARHRLLQAPLVLEAQAVAWDLLQWSMPPEHLCHYFAPVAGLLGPHEQARLTNRLLPVVVWSEDRLSEDIEQTRLYQAFKNFVPLLAQLNPTLRAKVVHEAIGFKDEAYAAMAVGGLGGGLAHLDAALIDQLVHKAASLSDEKWCAQAIRALSAGLAQMNPDQRQRLWQAAMSVLDAQPQGRLLEGLCAAMKHLPSDPQDDLFTRATTLSDPSHLAYALAGLANSIDVLDKEHTETVFAKALSLPDRTLKGRGVCALAAKVEHLTPEQRRRLVDDILAHPSPREMAALGPRLGHVAPEQQDRLLEALVSQGDYVKATAIAGMAAGLPSLDPARRDKIAAIVLGMDRKGSHTPGAIGALGPHLEHLEVGRRNALVDQALLVLGNPDDGQPPGATTALTRGLGAGLGALREDQRQALVTAVVATTSCPSGSTYFNRLMLTALAIAGLASGRQHLSSPQLVTLIEAARQLKVKCRATQQGPELHRLYALKIKAVAVFGLAAA